MRSWGWPDGKYDPEHLSIYGPNGSGKSFFEKTVLEERVNLRGSHAVLIATKPADSTIKSMGWPIITKWPPDYGKNQTIFWAKAPGLGRAGMVKQRAMIVDLLERLWEPESNRIIIFDEIAYLQHELAMGPILTRYYREARALGITLVATTQRPAGVTRYMHSESKWTAAFAPADEEDAERNAQILGSKRYFKRVLLSLNREKHEFVFVRNLTGEAFISRITPKKNRSTNTR